MKLLDLGLGRRWPVERLNESAGCFVLLGFPPSFSTSDFYPYFSIVFEASDLLEGHWRAGGLKFLRSHVLILALVFFCLALPA